MSALSHVKSDTIGDFTGTITGFNSQGSTTTIAATDLVRPSDWNSAHNFFQTISGNTAGQSTASGTNLVVGGTDGVTVSLSTAAGAATLWVGGPGAAVTYSYFNPQDAYLQVAGQQGQSTLHMQPAKFPNVQFDRWAIPMINTNSSNSSGSHTISFHVGIYSNNAGTLSRLVSTSSSTAVTHSGTAGSYSHYSGIRLFTIPHTTTITEGQYWIGVLSMTTSGGANGSYSQVLASQLNSSFFGHFGSSVNKSIQYTRGLGILSVQTAALPAAVNFTDLSGASNSLVLRQPIVYVVSGTN